MANYLLFGSSIVLKCFANLTRNVLSLTQVPMIDHRILFKDKKKANGIVYGHDRWANGILGEQCQRQKKLGANGLPFDLIITPTVM